MSRLFTIAKLIQRGRQRCDQENADILSPAEWQAELSTIWGEFQGLIIESGARYYETTYTFSTASGTQDYALPTDFLATIGLDELRTAGHRYELGELLAQERNVYSFGNGGYPEAFALIGQNIRIYPTPSGVHDMELVYAPQATDISEVVTTTEIDVITPDGESFFIWSLALIGGLKEESDMAVTYARQMEAARKRVIHWAAQQSLHTPKRRYVTGGRNGQNGTNRNDYDPGDYWY